MSKHDPKADAKAEAARILSMEPDEIFDVAAADGVGLVRTLDGNVLVITTTDDDTHEVALLVKPRPTFNGFPVAYPDLSEAEALKRLGSPKLDDPRPRPADPELTGAEGAFASPGELATTAAALAGTSSAVSTTPVEAPGQEHAEAVAEAYVAGSAEGEAEVVEEAVEAADEDTPEIDAAKGKADRTRRNRS